ncbi:cysteine and histidine-rich protein 1 homolog isoform X2 [Varroa jacobsoni]|nr:cysteine and histidine-rich protein 1 homolog isoform X2 [Varroa destructor]XP_022667436.1 cysteine and histidine-rich protein 1 homolog isoform X2 [Varroa destructor]XP_022702828.1 cysteine and histidine-rich protein 1 homolog isoform X2 [Varroa jacobsoni]XP_022702829.1 cysteine and histidine-rich protein 1 homolog isoform X2 [Varroa jacobsoni]
MCAGCFTHLLADARLRDESPATCPNCRTIISRELCSRNLAVEKAVCELPAECQFCAQQLPRSEIAQHESRLCDERKVSCDYAKIGCQWLGPYHELERHRNACTHPNKSGREVLAALQRMDDKEAQQLRTSSTLFELLSLEKLIFNDLQFKPYRTDEYITKLYYETHRFSSFGLQWACKAFVNNNQKDPQLSTERHLSYQLVLKGKLPSPMTIHYLVLPGPFGDVQLEPHVYQHEFSENSIESPIQPLLVKDSHECNRLLSSKVINFRLIMFQTATTPAQPSKS